MTVLQLLSVNNATSLIVLGAKFERLLCLTDLLVSSKHTLCFHTTDEDYNTAHLGGKPTLNHKTKCADKENDVLFYDPTLK
jgi:hypothetical protein